MDSVNPAVSVIVPIYKVQAYIEKCARSLFEQTLESLEIIFVDDCSPDNSVEIIQKTLEKFQNRNSLTRIIRMPTNTGQAGVRRQGIIEAKGQYIIHCDGDDWVDISLYEKMYNIALRDKADIVICDFMYETSNGTHLYKQPDLSKNASEALRNWYKCFFHMSCANKMVKRDIYFNNNIFPWPGLNMWEDNGLMFRVFSASKKISQIHDAFYHYNRTNETSMSAAYGRTQVNQMIDIAKSVTKYFKDNGIINEYLDSITALQFYAKINLITDDFNGLKEYKSLFPGSEKIASKLNPNSFSSKGKIRWKMVGMHLGWLFILLFKTFRLLSRK